MYAMSLFKTQPFDFLIKPITFKIVEGVMERCLKVYIKRTKYLSVILKRKGGFIKFLLKTLSIFTVKTKR